MHANGSCISDSRLCGWIGQANLRAPEKWPGRLNATTLQISVDASNRGPAKPFCTVFLGKLVTYFAVTFSAVALAGKGAASAWGLTIWAGGTCLTLLKHAHAQTFNNQRAIFLTLVALDSTSLAPVQRTHSISYLQWGILMWFFFFPSPFLQSLPTQNKIICDKGSLSASKSLLKESREKKILCSSNPGCCNTGAQTGRDGFLLFKGREKNHVRRSHASLESGRNLAGYKDL